MTTREINIKMLTWGSFQLSASELVTVTRHPYMILVYTVTLSVMYQLRYHADEQGAPFWINLLIYSIAQLLPLPLLVGVFLLLSRNSSTSNPINIYATPLIFAAIFFSALTAEVISGLLGGNSNISIVHLFAWSLLQTLFGELLGALVGAILLPAILAQIRSVHSPQVHPSSETAAVENEPEPEIARVRTFRIGERNYPTVDLLYARAEGNYVDLVFTTGRLYTLATLTSVVEQLEAIDGFVLNRSIWVSAKAIKGYRRDRSNYVVTLIDDHEFRVARSRATAAVDWLQLIV